LITISKKAEKFQQAWLHSWLNFLGFVKEEGLFLEVDKNMRTINLETWPRREHFNMFSKLDIPHFNICANVDLTSLYPFI
jgi:hypothetical protein